MQTKDGDSEVTRW